MLTAAGSTLTFDNTASKAKLVPRKNFSASIRFQHQQDCGPCLYLKGMDVIYRRKLETDLPWRIDSSSCDYSLGRPSPWSAEAPHPLSWLTVDEITCIP
jgi:hypothetical protein